MVESLEPKQVPVFTEPFMRGDRNSPVWWDWLNDVRRSLNEGIVNVKHPYFGAKGDGVTIDSDALDAAVDYASTKGGVLFFPPGGYMISRPLVLPDNGFGLALPRILGSGMFVSGLKAKNGSWSGAQLIDCQGTAFISDFQVNGNSQAGVHGITAPSTYTDFTSVFERVYVALCPGTAIRTTGGRMYIDKCFLNTNGIGIDFVADSKESVVKDTEVLGADPCIANRNDGNEGHRIVNCTFLPNPGVGTKIGIFMEGGVEVLISGCTIEGPGANTGKSVWLSVTNARSVKIVDSWLGSGFRCEGGASHIDLRGNTFPGGAPILFSGSSAGSIQDVIINGNHLYENVVAPVTDKIVFSNILRAIIAENIVTGTGDTFFANGATNTSILLNPNWIDQPNSTPNTTGSGVQWGLSSW